MNILMTTNTYLPHIGGVARSVASFSEAFRRRGHRVLVVAPASHEDDTAPPPEAGVHRVPALQNFNGSGFAVKLPIPLDPTVLDRFVPDVVHSHHPFLLGDTAVRIAARFGVGLVFTHHTLYERYTHYLPVEGEVVERLAVHLPTAYANQCDAVVAPSESLAHLLRSRGVTSPVAVVPTGIDPATFAGGHGPAARRRHGLPAGDFVVGHVGRLAPEKNLDFLAAAVAAFLGGGRPAWFLVVGDGPAAPAVRAACARAGVADRLRETGPLEGRDLANAYAAMDAFAFASQSETQGLVVAEAMTARVPVVALDGPGVRDVVADGVNGLLLPEADEAAFAAALAALADDAGLRRHLAQGARLTAREFALDRCADRVLGLYEGLARRTLRRRERPDGSVEALLRVLWAECGLWYGRLGAAFQALDDAF